MSGAAGARRSLHTNLPQNNQTPKGQPPIARAALFGLCPQCGAQTLFDGPAKFAPHCRVCSLDFQSYNVGDGPAAFLTLIVGALIDATSALYLFVPLLAPVLLESGFNITTIGVMMTVNLAVGLVTPPVGINLFVAAGIAKTPLFEVAKGVLPFVIAGFIVTVLTAYIPFLSNFLPDLMGIQ